MVTEITYKKNKEFDYFNVLAISAISKNNLKIRNLMPTLFKESTPSFTITMPSISHSISIIQQLKCFKIKMISLMAAWAYVRISHGFFEKNDPST
jgi:hypothetical protein